MCDRGLGLVDSYPRLNGVVKEDRTAIPRREVLLLRAFPFSGPGMRIDASEVVISRPRMCERVDVRAARPLYPSIIDDGAWRHWRSASGAGLDGHPFGPARRRVRTIENIRRGRRGGRPSNEPPPPPPSEYPAHRAPACARRRALDARWSITASDRTVQGRADQPRLMTSWSRVCAAAPPPAGPWGRLRPGHPLPSMQLSESKTNGSRGPANVGRPATAPRPG